MTMMDQINLLNPWFYNLKIGDIEVVPGVGSPHTSKELVERTEYMKFMFVDEVIKRYNFKGKKILDVGANCSYWSSFYAKAGAESVVAIEGRQQFIDQSKLYWGENKFLPEEKIRFICGDVAKEDVWSFASKFEPYDFCLCCGILYHITQHDFVLRKIDSFNPKVIFVDTRVSLPEEKHAKEFEEVGDWKFDAIPTSRVAKHPTIDYLNRFFIERNYRIEYLPIPNALPKDNTMQGKDNYNLKRRVAFLCFKNE